MKQFILTLLLGLLGFSSVYASFPVTETNNLTSIEIVDEETEESKKLSKRQKVVWFLVGLVGGILGVIIALIAQLISKKKKGQFKFALLGAGVYYILYTLLMYAIEGELPFEIGEIFILG